MKSGIWICLLFTFALVAAWIGVCQAVGIPIWAQMAGGFVCGAIGARFS